MFSLRCTSKITLCRRTKIKLYSSNGIWIHNHSVCKQMLNGPNDWWALLWDRICMVYWSCAFVLSYSWFEWIFTLNIKYPKYQLFPNIRKLLRRNKCNILRLCDYNGIRSIQVCGTTTNVQAKRNVFFSWQFINVEIMTVHKCICTYIKYGTVIYMYSKSSIYLYCNELLMVIVNKCQIHYTLKRKRKKERKKKIFLLPLFLFLFLKFIFILLKLEEP